MQKWDIQQNQNLAFCYLQENLVINMTWRDAAKISSKREVQKTAEVTGDLIGNKIADKNSSVAKKKVKKAKQMKDKKFTYHQKKDTKVLMT